VTLVGVPREKFEGPKESMRFSRVPLWQPPLMVLCCCCPPTPFPIFTTPADISPHSHDIESSATMALYGTIPGSPIYTTTQTPKTNGVMPIGCRLSCARTPRGARPRACLCASSKCHGHARRTHKEARVRGPC